MKRSRQVIGISILVIILVIGAAGFLQSTSRKAKLRNALNVARLPSSIRELEIAEDSWTDYVIEARFNIDPIDFDRLLTGRPYQKLAKSGLSLVESNAGC